MHHKSPENYGTLLSPATSSNRYLPAKMAKIILLLWFSPCDQGIPINRPRQTTNVSASVINDSPKFATCNFDQ